MAKAEIFKIVDDKGALTGTPGEIVEMTSKEAAEVCGLLLSTVRKRIGKGYRKWSLIAKDPEQAKAEGRMAFANKNTGHFRVEAEDRNKKRAHEERVLEGNKPL